MTLSYPDSRLLIANEWVDALEGKHLQVVNPATGVAIGKVACAGEKDLERAVVAAVVGFNTWKNTPAIERAALMRRAAVLVKERLPEIASVLTMEQGKPIAEAQAEVFAAVDIIEWFADEGRRVYGRVVPSRNLASQQLVLKEPVGPVAAFTPWNFPVNQVVRKLCAALAAGCSIIVKAPEETPAAPAALLNAFVDAGIPAGVVGLVFGEPSMISEYLIAHPAIRKITFTGSTSVGKQLAALAGRHMKRATMELGGHAPVIVAEDANLQAACMISAGSKFYNAGQVCISPTRFLVHVSLKDAFAEGLAKYAEGLTMGNGIDPATRLGPLANSRRVAAMNSVIADASAKGARVLTGGKAPSIDGNFFAPTVLTDVPADAVIFNEEPFGPVAAIRSFQKIEEALAEANRLPFGLAGYAFTGSLATAQLLTRGLEVGMLWINQPAAASAEMPFGGVKDSGYGSEGGPEAIEAYLNTKSVSLMGV